MPIAEKIAGFVQRQTGVTIDIIAAFDEQQKLTVVLQELRVLEDGVLQHLYDAVLQLTKGAKNTKFFRRSPHLWIFSHPTSAVFKAFIADIALSKSFCFVLFGAQPSRKQRKEMAAEDSPDFLLGHVARKYTELLREVLLPGALYKYGGKVAKVSLYSALKLQLFLPPTDQVIRDLLVEHIVRSSIRFYHHRDNELLNSIQHPAAANVALLTELVGRFLPEVLSESDRTQVYVKSLSLKKSRVEGYDQIQSGLRFALRAGYWIRFCIVVNYTFTISPELLEKELTAVGEQLRAILNSNGVPPHWKQTMRGCVPVGIKIHSFLPQRLRSGLPGLNTSAFKIEGAESTIILPAVGSAECAIALIREVERRIGHSVIGNQLFQIQVCSPGRLTPDRVAVLGIGFLLGSDNIRDLRQAFPTTTHRTGRRLIVYGAGACDRNFSWRSPTGEPGLYPETLGCRTDVLTCTSEQDIRNVNVLATILAHEQFGGYWSELGRWFRQRIKVVLDQHLLGGLLSVPWVASPQYVGDRSHATILEEEDQRFAEAMNELSGVVMAETALYPDQGVLPSTSLISSVYNLVQRCRETIARGVR